jgi:DNA polymerase I
MLNKPELIVIRTAEEVQTLRKYLNNFEYVAFDTETTGLTKYDEIIGISVCAEESKAFYIVVQEWDNSESRLNRTNFNTMFETNSLVSDLQSKMLIAHNSVFDCMMIESYFKVSLINSLHTDTLILAHLLDENRRVGLKELGKTLFGEDTTEEQRLMKESVLANGGLLTKDKYEMYKADSELIGRYGAQDALLTYKLFLTLVPELYEQGLEDFFYKDESMPLLKGPTYQMNTTGLQVDTNKLLLLKKTLEAECMEAKAFIYDEIQVHIKDKYPGTKKNNTFNIGSSQQLAWLLFGQLGLEFGTLTKGGKTVCRSVIGKIPYTFTAKRDFIHLCQQSNGSIVQPEAYVNGKLIKAKKLKEPWGYICVDKRTLEKLAPKYRWIERLLEYQRKTKLLNTYVKGIEERTKYSIIQPSFLQHGTTSGRYACRNPNFQNLPRNDQRIKECIIARPDKVFVSADFSQLEPRVFAFYSKDERLLSAFKSGDDFYSVIGMDTFDITDATPKKDGHPNAFGIKYKDLRDGTKTFSLAAFYGGTAHQLAPGLKKSVEDTSDILERYFDRFPGVQDSMLEAHKLAKTQGFVTNHFGRPRRMPEALKITKLYGDLPHGELPYEIRNILNLAVNHRIQSTGASIVNRSAIKFYNDCRDATISTRIVLQVHDELIVECNEEDSETVSLLLQNAMENAVYLEGIDLEAIPRITKNLSK